MTDRTGKRTDLLIGFLIACFTAILLTVTAPAFGLTWDEPNYIVGAESYVGWFTKLVQSPAEAFQPQVVAQYWSSNHEHPPVDKVWSGWVWAASRHFLDDLTAHRLGNILLVAALIGLLYYWLARAYGRSAGFFAAAALLFMPRFFFHAHLAALDVPVAAAICFVTYLFWRTIDRREWWWGLVLGLVWGLAEAIKLNATFLPIGLAIWCLVGRRKWYILFRFLLMGASAVLAFWLVWPWMYFQTWSRLLEYINFHVSHYKIGQWYLGHYYVPPPWHFALVMIWAVVPLATLLLAFVGMARAGKGGRDNGLVWLLISSAITSIAPFLFGKSLAYDNDRLFMPVYPFLAALAGVGFAWVWSWIQRAAVKLGRPGFAVPAGILCAGLLFVPQSFASAGLYPHLLSYYSEGIGGLPGATKIGLETTYWCETYATALPYINAHAEPGDHIWVEPWSFDVMVYYQRHGLLRSDVAILNNTPGTQSLFGPEAQEPVYGDYPSANWILLEYRQTQYEQFSGTILFLTDYLKSLGAPVVSVRYQDIPLMELYHR